MKQLKKLIVILAAISLLSCSNNSSTTEPNNNGGTVTPEVIHVTGVTLNKHSLSLKVGDSFTLVASVAPENARDRLVTFSSSNTSIATIDNNGKVVALKEGKATISVKTNDGNFTDKCEVNVTNNIIYVDSISLNKSSLSLKVGESFQLVAEVAPKNATNQNIIFASNNVEVASVSKNGLVTAIKEGNAIITATCEDGEEMFTRCLVTVEANNDGDSTDGDGGDNDGDNDGDEGEGGKTDDNKTETRRMQDVPILHCWNWSATNIANNLEKIKEAGFKAVQLSPMQPQKDYYAGGGWKNEWWKLYQPLGFKVAGSNESTIGTKTNLEDLCDKAESLGIDVIMDVVTNHLAGGSANSLNSNVKKYEPDIYDKGLIHKNGECKDWEDPPQLLTYALGGYPDLQTESETVQNRIISMLKEYIDCGVDGFRFDAAKHIETPDDGLLASNYWPNVINSINEYATSKNLDKPYVYGELLGTIGNNRKYSSYTKYMAITDTRQSSTIFGVAQNSTLSSLTDRYISGVDPSKLVVWAESHDTFANAGWESSNASVENVHKAYIMQTSRKDVSTLYFARPDTNSKMGEVGREDYKNIEIKAINSFHNTFIGQEENIYSTSGCFVNERGTKGLVLVGINNESNNVTITTNNVKDGDYVDLITNNEYKIENNKLTVSLTNNACVLVNKDTSISTTPTISIGEYKEVYKGTQNISINTSNATSVTYKINNGDEITLNGSSIVLSSELADGKINIKITAKNNTESISKIIHLIKTSKLENSKLIITDVSDQDNIYLVWAWKDGNGSWFEPSIEKDIYGYDLGNNTNFKVVKFPSGTTKDNASWNINGLKQTDDLILGKTIYSFSEFTFK